jgi:hypothetical protein
VGCISGFVDFYNNLARLQLSRGDHPIVKRLNLKAWRLTLESWRLALESRRLTLDLWRLTF